MRPKAVSDLDHLLGEFANELVDQQLRVRLETQFADMRTLIVAQAFSEGNLLDSTQIEGDIQADPRGIGGVSIATGRPVRVELFQPASQYQPPLQSGYRFLPFRFMRWTQRRYWSPMRLASLRF